MHVKSVKDENKEAIKQYIKDKYGETKASILIRSSETLPFYSGFLSLKRRGRA